MSKSCEMFSLLSRGYGTWDGIAKGEPVEIENDIFSLDDLRLPPIANTYETKEPANLNYKKTFNTKPFQLPKVKVAVSQSMPKTYTTRKGALLLYAEDYFLPGSPKAKKRRRKAKQQATVRLKTLTDLRDFILDYKKNGGDPLFLALLKKRLSSSHLYDNRVRPGFSPKRYIATLGRALQEESWNKLVSTGSLKDPALQSYNPFLPSVHNDGSMCELFPSKPQVYSTMSLPPVSPSSSMLGSSFNFYRKGMSTGAASLISVNSEEYAPSSRAMSPVESLNERLSELEPICRKNEFPYALLDSSQKEELISKMLVKRTLETVDSDLQNWPSQYNKQDSAHTSTSGSDSNTSVMNRNKRKFSKGSLKSSSLTSISRLPPIQSAGARPTTPVDEVDTASHVNSIVSGKSEAKDQSESRNGRISEASSGSGARGSGHSSVAVIGDESRDFDAINAELNSSDESSQWGDALTQVIDFAVDTEDSQEEEEKKILELAKSLQEPTYKESEEAVAKSREEMDRDLEESVDLNDVHIMSELDEQFNEETQEGNRTSDNCENETQVGENGEQGRGIREPSARDIKSSELPAGDKTLDENSEQLQDREETANIVQDDTRSISSRSTTSILSIMEDHGPSPEPPPPITFDQLHTEARAIASRVLNRPQTGRVFKEDVQAALAMWADRLSTLLDLPRKDARTSSAALNRKMNYNQPRNAGGTQFPAAPGRKRKISQSAGPTPATLRQALLISGGDFPAIESLKSLPPIRIPQATQLPNSARKTGSGVSQGHSHYEPLKDSDGKSTRGVRSVGPVRSAAVTERLSNSDLQMEILNLVASEDFEYVEERVQSAQDGDDSEDELFRAAIKAVVTDLNDNLRSEEHRRETRTVTPAETPPIAGGKKKVKTPPFKVKRPSEEKFPSGLQSKQPETKAAGKAPRKTATKKDAKKATKKGGKAAQTAKEKSDKIKDDSIETELKSVKDGKVQSTSDVESDLSPELSVGAASETSKRLEDFATSPTSDLESTIASPKHSASSAAKENKSPSIQSAHSTGTSVMEQPRLVPRPVEPAPVPEADIEQEKEEQEKKDAELRKKKEKEVRAAKRVEERAAAAERRRQEVERKRREKEEARRRQLEEDARLEKVREGAEEEMKKREMEMRKIREEKEAERSRKEEEELRKEKDDRARIERDKRKREEYERRKQELIARRKLEEEIRKEQDKMEAELEEANRRAEEERLQEMEESDRIALQEKMRRQEEELRKRLEAERKIQEEQQRKLDEQRRMREEAIALLRQKRLQRQLFISGVIKEGLYLSLSQRLSRAFTFSYYDMLAWSFLNHTRTMSPLKDVIGELKKNIPHTIYEIEEVEEE